MINPPNRLKAKVAQFGGANLEDIIVEAEAGLEKLAEEYRTLLLAAIAEMKEALANTEKDSSALDSVVKNILRGIVNMKGEAVSYGYPVISQIAAAFQVFLEKADPSEPRYAEIIATHLGAIEMVLAKYLKDPAEGRQLVASLDKLLNRALKGSAKKGPVTDQA